MDLKRCSVIAEILIPAALALSIIPLSMPSVSFCFSVLSLAILGFSIYVYRIRLLYIRIIYTGYYNPLQLSGVYSSKYYIRYN